MATMTLERFEEKLGTLLRTGGLSRAIAAGGAELGIEMERISKIEYLNGPRPSRLAHVSGALSRSTKFDTRTTGTGLRVWLQSGGGPEAVSYAVFHELGTRKMRARPFLRPAREEGIEMAPAIFTKHIIEALDDSLGGA